MCNKQQKILNMPEWLDKGKENRTVCVDECIVDQIMILWSNKIETLGCCCGHNKNKPSLIIEERYKNKEIINIAKIIEKYDERQWDIYQWGLKKVKTTQCKYTKE